MTDSEQDIRWVQRFENYQRALASLAEAVTLTQQRPLSKLEQQGLIQGFEYTHELAWKTLKDFLKYRGLTDIIGSRDAARVAFREGVIENGAVWMEMIKSRNLSSHTYREELANEVASKTITQYYAEFCALERRLSTYIGAEYV